MFKPANAVQIRVYIDEIQPEVWRRLVLPIRWNLQHLHLGIQAAFNWWNYHLYEFRIGGLRYGSALKRQWSAKTLSKDVFQQDLLSMAKDPPVRDNFIAVVEHVRNDTSCRRSDAQFEGLKQSRYPLLEIWHRAIIPCACTGCRRRGAHTLSDF